MAYSDHFKITDDLILHLDPIVSKLADRFFESRYSGFLAVSSVTVLELGMKAIFMDFATAKHKVLASFCAGYFDQINGRIKLKSIEDDYLSKFGTKYQTRFKKTLDKLERQELLASRASIKASYGNLITWRHEFAHKGNIPATYSEVRRAYAYGKQIMDCLAHCMRR